MPLPLVQLQPGVSYPVEVADALRNLTIQADAELKP
jgi:hypothetical protein